MIIPLGMVGLVQITRTVLLLIAMTALMTGGLGATDTCHKIIVIITML